jgi:transcriptional regulator of acetoin/glycerol metabolism
MSSEPRDTFIDGRTADDESPGGPGMSLVVVHRDGVSVVPLREGEPIIVGRDEPSTVRPRSQRLSRQHARIGLTDGAAWVEDLGSTNGTWLGERRVTGRVALRVGDELRLGSVAIALRAPSLVSPEPGIDRIAIDPAMVRLFDAAARVGASGLGAWVDGEPGSGRRTIARHVHASSPRQRGPLVWVESGQAADVEAGWVAARGGTLVVRLDNTTEAARAAFWRGVAQAREVGWVVLGAPPDGVDAVVLRVPPLRERVSEIPAFAHAFVQRANQRNGRDLQGLTNAALERLARHPWAGHVAELRRVVEAAALLSSGPRIDVGDLPWLAGVDDAQTDPTPASMARLDDTASWGLDLKAQVEAYEDALIRGAVEAAEGNQTRAAELLVMPRRTLVYRWPQAAVAAASVPPDGQALRSRVEAFERQLVQEALARSGGDVAQAARVLGVQRRTLTQRLQGWGWRHDGR